jgi:protein-S-isoprenylcysteine O-methyltransferase Ste14
MQFILGIALFIIWAVFIAYWILSAVRDRSPFKRKSCPLSNLSYMAVPIAIWVIAASLAAPWLLTAHFLPDTIIFAILGLLITGAGIGFAIWARIHLGRNWTGQPAIREDHRIIRTGPYAIVRNPIYSGLVLALIGTAIATGSVTSLCIVVLVLVVFIIKIRTEETLLREEFGEEYDRYRREVKALIPFVI